MTILRAMMVAILALMVSAVPAFAQSPSHARTHHHSTWFDSARTVIPDAIERYDPLVKQTAAQCNAPMNIVFGIITTESQWNPNARGGVSQADQGAKSMVHFSCNMTEISCSMKVGACYLVYLQKTYHVSLEVAIICYNRGPGKCQAVKYPRRDEYFKRVMFAALRYNPSNLSS